MPRSRMPHVSVEARPEAAADRGSLKRERPDVDVVDLVEDSDTPSLKGSRRRGPMTIEEKREKCKQVRAEKMREAREKEEKQMRQMREEREKEEKWMREEREKEKLKENRWNICDYCYSVPFASDATMFCPECKNDFRVWYDFCNRFSALERMMGMPGY